MKKILLIVSALFMLIVGSGCENSEKETQKTGVTILVGAAASLTDVLNELEPVFEKETGIDLDLQYGSSGTLKEQIKNGAPIDVFFSASKKDVDELVAAGLLADDQILLKNQLVLVKSKSSKVKSLDDLSSVQYIAVGDPASVPVGKYTQEALKNLGMLETLEGKFTYGKDVTQVLSWVGLGNAEAGFVYYSDYVRSEGKVDLVEKIDASKHSKIVYPIGVVKNSRKQEEAKKFIEFLKSDKAKAAFEKWGFSLAQ
ncbi:MAG: molybdate ABC transporter substrate-binding protein [Fusobacteria bacterium]|nr:molybdate ABC transporter substrate-binding protein [Fusobacteriota bacterium]